MSVRLRQWKDKSGKHREAWIVDVQFEHADGRIERIRKASPVGTRRGAEQYERDLRLALVQGRYGREVIAQEVPTLAEFVERFLTYSENNNKPSTVASKRHTLKNHVVPYFGSKPLDKIGPADLEAFKAAMRAKISASRARKEDATIYAIRKRRDVPAQRLSLKTINNALTILRKLLAVAEEQGVIEHIPRIRFFRVEKPAFDFLDFDEAERLVNAADNDWRLLLDTALKTGLRQGELIGLQWSDLDIVRGKLHVRRTIWKGEAGLPKGGRARTVDLPGSIVDALKAYRHLKGPYVFCQADGSLLTPGLLKAPLDRALRRAGIARDQGRIGWHDLRHTYGSHLAMRGVPLKVIQELMGHATIEMTLKYAHLSPETKQDAVQVLDQPAPRTAHGRHMAEKTELST
jgi:integrase